MKHAIVSSKDLGTNCWSAIRLTDSCEDCSRVMWCNLPAGIEGRIKLLDNKINKAKKDIKRWRQEQNVLRNRL